MESLLITRISSNTEERRGEITLPGRSSYMRKEGAAWSGVLQWYFAGA